MKGHVYDLNDGREIENVDIACTNFLFDILPKNGTWAGSESISAVTQMMDVNTLIITKCGDCKVTANGFDVRRKKTAILAFGRVHLNEQLEKNELKNANQKNSCVTNAANIPKINRNHYNSVTEMDQRDIFIMSKFLASKIITKQNTDGIIDVTYSIE